MTATMLDAKLKEYCREHRLSCVVRVTQKDEILFDKGFGFAHHEKQLPFTRESMFTLYSLSKPFCALGLLRLVDRGLVDLDSHPGRYVAEASGFDSRVTIRQMLQHTSGVPDFAPDPGYMAAYAPGYAHKTREHLKILTGFPSFFEPGTAGRYSNIGYQVCALIMENISGLSYADYMRKEVFEPLGMKTALVDNETLQIPNRVQGYRMEGDQVVPTPKCHDWMLGAGDLVGTVDDVYALNRAVKHRLLLKPETWEQVLTPSPLNNKGLGCTVTQWHGKKRITHNGGSQGFRSLHIHLPEDDFDIIILSNCGFHNPGRSDKAELIYSIFYDSLAKAEKPMDMDSGYI